MKIKTPDLVSACKRVLPLAQVRGLPITSHFLISAQGNRLSITADNLEAREQLFAPCDGDLAPVCIPAKLFSSLSQAANGEVNIEALKDVVQIESGWSSKLPTLPVDEFPPDSAEEMKGIGVSIPDLLEGIKGVAWCAMDPKIAEKRNNHDRASVFIDLEPKRMSISTADVGAGCLFERGLICAKFSGIVPISQIDAIIASLEQPNATIWSNEKQFGIKHDNGSFKCRMLEGKFPDIRQYLPADAPPVAILDREQFLTHCENCDLVDPESQNIEGGKVWMLFEAGKLTIAGRSKAGASYSATMTTEGTRELKVCFATKYLIPALKACTADKVAWMQESSLTTVHFRYGDFHTVMSGMRYE